MIAVVVLPVMFAMFVFVLALFLVPIVMFLVVVLFSIVLGRLGVVVVDMVVVHPMLAAIIAGLVSRIQRGYAQ